MKTNNRYLFWSFIANGFSTFKVLKNSNDIKNFKNFSIHGNGRSYSHCCLNNNNSLLSTRRLNKVILFNKKTGELVAEAGILMKEIHKQVNVHRWVVKITPGTQYVTLGGAIANDIHGKNYHTDGSFIQCVNFFKLTNSKGKHILCSRTENKELFYATFGGLGLTGLITEVSITLKKVPSLMMNVERVPFSNMSDFVKLSQRYENKFEYSVGWMDCLSSNKGRGFILNSNFIKSKKQVKSTNSKLNLKYFPKIPIFNRITIPIFNLLYYFINHFGTHKFIQPYTKNLYPLDGVLNWNRLYGSKGFVQYQCVIPIKNIRLFEKEFFNTLSKYNLASFLVVLKLFNNYKKSGILSFPKNGLSIAIDFRNTKETPKLINSLHKITGELDGRSYLAKDLFIDRENFMIFYPQYKNFIKYMDAGISSNMKRVLFK